DQVYYPPYTFLLFYLLTGLDMFRSWLAFVLAAVVVNVLLATALSRRRLSYRASLFVALAVVFNYVTWTDWRMGNFTALLLLPLQVAFWEAFRGRSFFAAGALAALSTLKPQYSPFLLVPAVVVGGWRGLTGFAGGLAVLGVMSLAAFGLDNCLAFPAALLFAEHVAASGVQVYSMQNLRGLLCCLAGQDAGWVRGLSTAAQVAALVWLVCLWLRERQQQEPSASFDKTLAITILSSLVFSLHTHFNDYLLAAVACISLWKLAEAQQGRGALLLRVLILALPGLTWAYFALVRLQVTCPQLLFAWAAGVLLVVCRYSASNSVVSPEPADK
ncbi:MAG TPA: glycosyltransferase family 87 protein, partial [Candidatus Obscuribacterales bacterium]